MGRQLHLIWRRLDPAMLSDYTLKHLRSNRLERLITHLPFNQINTIFFKIEEMINLYLSRPFHDLYTTDVCMFFDLQPHCSFDIWWFVLFLHAPIIIFIPGTCMCLLRRHCSSEFNFQRARNAKAGIWKHMVADYNEPMHVPYWSVGTVTYEKCESDSTIWRLGHWRIDDIILYDLV